MESSFCFSCICTKITMLLFLLSLMLPYTSALNLDKQNPRLFWGPNGSYFGFSFDFYQTADKRMHIVVGAPRLNTSVPNIQHGGGVYLCPWGSDANGCSVIPFDQSGDRTEIDENKMVVFKSNQWLGATVRTWKTSIVACAPLQEYNFIDLTSKTGESGKTPTGACYLTEDLKKFYEFAPCRDSKTESVHKWASFVNDNRYCEIGFSAEISKEGILLAGAPGGYYFEGLHTTVPLSGIQRSTDAIKKQISGLYMSKEDKYVSNSYKGFAVAYGEFTQDNSPEIVLGCPRLSNEGTVEIFSKMVKKVTLRGEQIASYFGHSVAVTDVNGDGLDDLLVGAPVFMERRTGGKLLEVGQVYLYKQKRSGLLDRNRQVLSGTHIYGQFGASIAPLGDLDQDGYNDVAVGSPFAGQHGAGCVHIYKGGKSGLSTHPSQILESPLDSPSRFGFALRGGEDIDQNGYPDLIVGAFGADRVYVYRAQPVVLLHTSLTFHPDSLNPEEKLCQIGIENVSCFNVSVCIRTFGKSLTKTLSLSANIQLDSQKSRFLRRTLFMDSSQPNKELAINVQSNSGQWACAIAAAYLRGENEFKDKLSPIIVSVNFSLSAAQSSSVLSPIIQGNTFLQEQIHILLDCGEDKVCIPNLHLEASWSKEPLVIGDDNLVQIYFTAMNFGEGAYEAELHVDLPSGAHYMKILGEAKEKILCTPKKANDTELVVCELGNPMKKEEIHAGLQLSISNLEDTEGNISFPMQIKSRNSDNSTVLWVHLNVTVKVSVDLLGSAHPSEVVLPLPNWKPKEDSKKPRDKGEQVSHIYELHNAGPGTVHIKLVIQSPENHEDDIFLYPLLLEIDKNIKCTNNSNLNYLQLDIAEPTTAPANFSKGDNQRLKKRELPREDQDDGDTGSDNSTSMGDVPQHKQPVTLSCGKSPCWEIECFIQNLEKGERVTLKLDSILWISSFMKRPLQQFTLRSQGYFHLTGVPYRIQPTTLLSTETHADTVVQWVTPDGQKEIPIWWIILGVLGGLLILALFIFVMWKLGFFTRTRPPADDHEELTEDE